MLCPKCGEEIEQQETCPKCGALLIEEPVEEEILQPAEEIAETAETPVEESAAESEEEPAETSAHEITGEEDELPEELSDTEVEDETAEEEVPAETPKKKKSLGAILVGVIIALLVVIIGCLGYALKVVSGGGSLPDLSEKYQEWKAQREDNKFDPAALGVTVTTGDETVAEITNEQLAFYYWGEYYYFVNAYGFSFDSTMRLDEQVYESVTDSETGETTVTTWHQYFLETACYSINQMEALKADGQAAGFTMPEEYQAEYDAILEAMVTNAATAGFVDAEGNGDALAFIQDSYGPDATTEGFEAYLYDSYYATAYSDHIYASLSYTDEEIEAYYDENEDSFLSYGIEKSEVPNVNVRHILLEPEIAEDGTISDEAWAAAEEAAEALLQEWETGDATEDSFAELANANSTDPGSNTTGGLYEDVFPGEMVETFNDWCFDESRQAGDTGIVKTDYGYHIMYFVSHTENFYWKTAAESDLKYYAGAEYIENMAAGYTSAVSETADVRYPDAVKEIMNAEG